MGQIPRSTERISSCKYYSLTLATTFGKMREGVSCSRNRTVSRVDMQQVNGHAEVVQQTSLSVVRNIITRVLLGHPTKTIQASLLNFCFLTRTWLSAKLTLWCIIGPRRPPNFKNRLPVKSNIADDPQNVQPLNRNITLPRIVGFRSTLLYQSAGVAPGFKSTYHIIQGGSCSKVLNL